MLCRDDRNENDPVNDDGVVLLVVCPLPRERLSGSMCGGVGVEDVFWEAAPHPHLEAG